MPLARRYSPEFAPGENSLVGLDYAPVLPPGVGIAAGALAIFTNTAVPAPADADFVVGPVTVQGRAIYANMSGGVAARDYQLRWTATDTQGHVWPRTALMLVAATS